MDHPSAASSSAASAGIMRTYPTVAAVAAVRRNEPEVDDDPRKT
jgi:hypothetical protein